MSLSGRADDNTGVTRNPYSLHVERKNPVWLERDWINYYARPLATEFICSFLFVYVAVSSAVACGVTEFEVIKPTSALLMSFTEGSMFAVVPYLARKLSPQGAGYANTSITFALILLHLAYSEKDNIGHQLARSILFIAAQFGGAATGAFFAWIALPEAYHGRFAANSTTTVQENVSGLSAVSLEILCTLLLVFVILSVRLYETRKSSLILAFSYVTVKMLAIPVSGGSFNLALTFGPAALNNEWKDIWVYVVGPLVGGFLGVLLFLTFHVDKLSEGFAYPINDDEDE